jgi:hypothetical protein
MYHIDKYIIQWKAVDIVEAVITSLILNMFSISTFLRQSLDYILNMNK